MSDVDLARFYRGDPEYFRILFDRLDPLCLRVARAILRNADDADDAVQETRIKIYARRHTFLADESINGWALTICRHHCIDQQKRRRYLSLHDADLEALRFLGAAPDESVDQTEFQERVRRAIHDLPPGEQDVAYCRLILDLSVADTASRTSRATGTVKATLSHALKKLRKSLSTFR